MQEGILSLMQLPKTVCAVEELHDAGCALISVLAHPTTGGVLASFATLGDVIARRAGRADRLRRARASSQQTTREKLPDDFGLAESNLRFGHVDAIVPRAELRPTLARLLRLFGRAELDERGRARLRERLAKLERLQLLGGTRVSAELERLAASARALERSTTDEEIWHSVELARHEERPYTLDYVERLFDDWFELHGDRGRADDAAIVAGLGRSTAARSR